MPVSRLDCSHQRSRCAGEALPASAYCAAPVAPHPVSRTSMEARPGAQPGALAGRAPPRGQSTTSRRELPWHAGRRSAASRHRKSLNQGRRSSAPSRLIWVVKEHGRALISLPLVADRLRPGMSWLDGHICHAPTRGDLHCLPLSPSGSPRLPSLLCSAAVRRSPWQRSGPCRAAPLASPAGQSSAQRVFIRGLDGR
jgi:hypothetical protein